MKMNRTLLKRVFQYTLAWAGLVALGGAIALAQAPAPAAAPAATAATGQRTDGQIEMDVVHALDGSKALKADLITAATIQGEVTLSGTVSSEASSELAEAIAGHVAGVTKVNNNLKVGNPQGAQDAQPADGGDGGAPPAAEGQAGPDEGPMPAPQAYPQAPQDQGQAPAPNPPARPGYGPYPPAPRGYPQQAPQDQGQVQAPYPPRRGYGPVPPPAPQAYEAPKGPVTIPKGTLLQVRTNEAVNSKRAKDGEQVQFTVVHDVAVGGVLAIPRGATVHGVVTEAKKSGALGGSPELGLKLTSLDLGGQSYDLDTDQFKVKGPNKAGQTAGNAFGGAVLGAIIGSAAGGRGSRGTDAGIGAGAGAAAGTAVSAASPGPGVWIPNEALVTFHLNTPLTVTPVSAQEASRLAQGLYQGGPTLYRRGYYPYGAPYYPGYPYYAYPPVYYRPYYMAGGYYYWR
jgi:hypothetical protein